MAIPISACSKDLTAKEWLFFIQTIMIAVMTVFMAQFHRVFQEKPVVVSPTAIKPCFSFPLMEPTQKKFRLYKDLLFYSIVASTLANLTLIAFECKLNVNKMIKTMVYGSNMIVGIMVTVLSAVAFNPLQNTTNKPVECKDLLGRFRVFFILSMSIGVAQTVFSMWILKDMYFQTK